MQNQLKQIYEDLLTKKISKQQALTMVRELKMRASHQEGTAALFVPHWQDCALPDAAQPGAAQPRAGQVVILCGTSEANPETLAPLVKASRCLLWPLRPELDPAQAYTEHAKACFLQVQDMLRSRPTGPVLLQIVVADTPDLALLAGLSGLFKTAAQENPQFAGQILLVEAQIGSAALARLLVSEAGPAPEVLVRYRAGMRQRRCWQWVADNTPPVAFKDHGVYLITGGLGALGMLFAAEILGQTGQAKVILTGRPALNAARQAKLQTLLQALPPSTAQNAAGRLEYRQLDLENPASVSQVIADIVQQHGQLNGILHAAGMIADNFILKKSEAEFDAVLAPKVVGTLNLEQASRTLDLDFLVLFSSIASAMGNLSQADYAAANGFMDQFAAWRNAHNAAQGRKGHILSINWSLWQQGGMNIDAQNLARISELSGMQPLPTAAALLAFHQSLTLPDGQCLITGGDPARVLQWLSHQPPGHAAASIEETGAIAPAAATVITATATAADSMPIEQAERYLSKQLSGVLKLAASKIDPQAPMEQYGIDSILAMQLTTELEKVFGPLSRTLFFEYQTIRQLAAYFVSAHGAKLQALTGDASTQPTPPVLPAAPALPTRRPMPSLTRFRQNDTAIQPTIQPTIQPAIVPTRPDSAQGAEPIAIVGLSGRYPESIDVEAFWQNLRAGKDCVTEVPASRWNWRDYYSDDRTAPGHHYSRWGGFISGVDEFDTLFFNIPPREAKHIDPQERLFLQHAWMALEDAGYTRAALEAPGNDDLAAEVGVYVGVMYSEYQMFGVEASLRGNRMGLNGSIASIANRVSYFMNLHGPSMTLDTMCSSSLTAIHLACQDLRSHRTAVAMAGGVNVSVHPNKYLLLSSGQFISSEGQCQSFGEGGNGYIPGEGVGVVILKRLSDAIKGGDHIYGLIRGSALSHGGKTNGPSVPNPRGQANAIRRALKDANVEPRQISYIEAHGTGTKLGDPIEIAALNAVFPSGTDHPGSCLIGSVKSNIGHCESAAGIAALTKVLLQMKHQEIVPSLHSARLNPNINFHDSAFTVNQTLRHWQQPLIDGQPAARMAGISSFGAGGSNAHLVVEEYVSDQRMASHSPGQAVAILLSARTAAQLTQKARDLLAVFAAKEDTVAQPQFAAPDLLALAWTLQIGREPMDERLGLIVSSPDELVHKLKAWLDGREDVDGICRGQARENRETLAMFNSDTDLKQLLAKWLAEGRLPQLVDLWAKGVELDWLAMYGDAQPQRVSLPNYPFAKERHWIDMGSSAGNAAPVAGMQKLHPLVHRNTSTLSLHSYSSDFGGGEAFFVDEAAATPPRRVLSDAAWLAMLHAAFALAQPEQLDAAMLELHHTEWAQAFAPGNGPLNLALIPGAQGVEFEIYSGLAEQEIIHCQGNGVWVARSASQRIDPAHLHADMRRGRLDGSAGNPDIRAILAGERQLLAEVSLLEASARNGGQNGEHDNALRVLSAALHTAYILRQGEGEPHVAWRPVALELARFITPCNTDSLIWVRYANPDNGAEAALDMDVLDPQGLLQIQIRGLRYRMVRPDRSDHARPLPEAAMATVSNPAINPASSRAAPVESTLLATPREVSFSPAAQSVPASISSPVSSPAPTPAPAAARAKPSGLALSAPASLYAAASSGQTTVALTARRAPIALADPANTIDNPAPNAAAIVTLSDQGNGVFALRVINAGRSGLMANAVILQLLGALAAMQQEASGKVLMLYGSDQCFLFDDSNQVDGALTRKLAAALTTAPFPVVAVMQGNALGSALLVGSMCDFMIGCEESQYGYRQSLQDARFDACEIALLYERLGAVVADDLLLHPLARSGKTLLAKGWSCAILPSSQVAAHAQKLALALAKHSQEALRLLKLHLSRRLSFLATECEFQSDLAAQANHTTRYDNGDDAKDGSDGIIVTRLELPQGADNVANLVAGLAAVFARAETSNRAKAIVIAYGQRQGDPDISDISNIGPDESEHLAMALHTLIAASALPVIVALESQAHDIGWLIGLLADGCVCNEAAQYTLSMNRLSLPLASRATTLLGQRFGAAGASEILLQANSHDGAQLQQLGGNITAVAQSGVLPTAIGLAKSLGQLARGAMSAWRAGRSLALSASTVRDLTPWREQAANEVANQATNEAANQATTTPVAVPLRSGVVTAMLHAPGILVVRMEDRRAKNMFSDDLVAGLNEVFAYIAQTASCKVVILTGFDNYFASGGTKENLLAIQAGEARFTDAATFDLALRCPIPVIAAMQGHGIGAGWALGMFADFTLFSERSEYVSPYMNYGFTPGAGATLVFPARIGHDLARETLLTGRQTTGRELQGRGMRLPVLKQDQVMPAAMALAQQVARLPRALLASLKQHLAEPMRVALEETCRLELAMHAKTFVGRADTLHLIRERFVQADEAASTTTSATSPTQSPAIPPAPPATSATPATPATPATITASSTMSAAHILAGIKTLLAQELQMREEDIDNGIQFVDLGLDSVSGVTWVRKINEQYGITIDATQIYSYPTLKLLSGYVRQEIRNQTGDPAEGAGIAQLAPVVDVADAAKTFSSPPPLAAQSAASVLAGLKTLLAQELQMREEDIDNGMQFVDLGLDSVSGVTWMRKINEQFGTAIEATEIYSYPNLKLLSNHVRQEIRSGTGEPEGNPNQKASAAAAATEVNSFASHHASAERTPSLAAQGAPLESKRLESRRHRSNSGSGSSSGNAHQGTTAAQPTLQAAAPAKFQSLSQPQPEPEPEPAPQAAPKTTALPLAPNIAQAAPRPDSIAVIGLAGKFPQAKNVDEFWRNIAAGRDCISEIPPQRWRIDTYYQEGEAAIGKTNSRWLGAMEEYDQFDPLFFNISPSEAESMDPQQRLFLQTCWNAIEHAGYDADTLSGSNCGVFVGCAATDYFQDAAEQRLSAQGFTGAANSILSARISYFLNLQGPCLAIDTACSSSLVAIANACDSLNSGNCNVALAGGVYVMAGPDMHIRTAQTGMLSTEGRCFSFDQRANGFVPGEAVASVMLKRLSDAERDGDSIYAVIRGWGINQDGRTNGITAPNPEAQSRLQRDVYQRWQIDPSHIQLIEAHGTGTKLGDPIEVQALKKSFGQYTRNAHFCALGSVKSNIGHCLTAAGVTGFIKLIQALRHRQLPPTIQFEKLNEHIALAGSPFYINDRLREWESNGNQARQAAVSSFGFSGTNAHIVLEEYPNNVRRAAQPLTEDGKLIVPLSAKTFEQLRQRAVDLLAALTGEDPAPDLAELAHTLQSGRVAMEKRLAFMVASIDELGEKLQRYLALQPDIGLGNTVDNMVDNRAQGELSQLMAAWLKGDEIDWNQCYVGDIRPRRIALPGYPFADERYWIDAPQPLAEYAHAAPLQAIAVPPASVVASENAPENTQEIASEIALALIVPQWQDIALTEQATSQHAEHVVVLCGINLTNTGELATLIPASRCLLWPSRPELDVALAYTERAKACFLIVQDMLRSRAMGKLLLQIVVADVPDGVLLAGLTGLFKTAAQENPQFAGQVILVEPHIATGALVRLLRLDAAIPQETLLRHRQEQSRVQRWQMTENNGQAPQVAFKDHGVYLITGGLGALGLVFAEEILRKTRHAKVVLTGRFAATPQKLAQMHTLAAHTNRLEYRQVNLEDLGSVQLLVNDVNQAHGQLNGILHAAGKIADNFILKKSLAEFDAVLAPKVVGTLNLELATQALELDFLVLFSSIAGALGNQSQADYAAANGFMDQFAAYSNAQMVAQGRKRRTLSLNWSLWQQGGMNIDAQSMANISDMTGMQPLQTAPALEAFHRSLALPGAQCLIVQGNLARLSAYLGQNGSGKAKATASSAASTITTAIASGSTTIGTAPIDAKRLADATMQRMKILFGGVIKLAPGRIDENKELSAYGIDSLMVTKLNGEFAKTFGRISKTLVYEYNTLAALNAYFVEHHREECLNWSGLHQPVATPIPAITASVAAISSAPAILRTQRGSGPEQPIAIIGLSGVYPQAPTLAQFWENLRNGVDSVTEIPAVRWPMQAFYEPDIMRAVEMGKSYCKWGGFVDQFDQFDPLFFGISPRDALNMDPQERMFLQTAWHALEDSGYTRSDLKEKFGRKVGVFAGITKQGFNLHGTESSRRDHKFYPHTSFGSLANRLSYLLDITGPSMPIDTMCSSSLTAIHEACEQIRRGDCDLAFAGAVNLYTHPSNYVDMSSQYALSRDGRCRSFGVGANGFVPGEGAGVMLLRPLDEALADGDIIHGLILGTHVNHGGKTNGYTVPNPRAQAELITRAIEKAGIGARDISYIEAHGTGTELGDPIEIEGLRQAFAHSTSETGYCKIGSAKSNIGHLEAAAGMAGVSKILLQMKHRQIAPSLHAEQLNPAIDFETTPFVVNTGLTPWEPSGPDGGALPRIAGISAFGAGGANAHVILQEFVSPVTVPVSAPVDGVNDNHGEPSQVIVPLSAKTPQKLLEVAAGILACIESADPPADVAALAYTLQIGRDAMEQRASFIVDSMASLADKLRAFIHGNVDIEDSFIGQAQKAEGDMADMLHDDGMQSALATWLSQKKLARLAQWWSRGLSIDWKLLYDDGTPKRGTPQRISLPGYPFATDSYWISEQQPKEAQAGQQRETQRSKTIEDIVNMIDSDSIGTEQALHLLDDALRE